MRGFQTLFRPFRIINLDGQKEVLEIASIQYVKTGLSTSSGVSNFLFRLGYHRVTRKSQI